MRGIVTAAFCAVAIFGSFMQPAKAEWGSPYGGPFSSAYAACANIAANRPWIGDPGNLVGVSKDLGSIWTPNGLAGELEDMKMRPTGGW